MKTKNVFYALILSISLTSLPQNGFAASERKSGPKDGGGGDMLIRPLNQVQPEILTCIANHLLTQYDFNTDFNNLSNTIAYLKESEKNPRTLRLLKSMESKLYRTEENQPTIARKSIGDFLDENKIQPDIRQKGACFDQGIAKDASAYFKNGVPTVCVSIERLRAKLPAEYKWRKMLTTIIHEVSHFVGTTEPEAELLQKIADEDEFSMSSEVAIGFLSCLTPEEEQRVKWDIERFARNREREERAHAEEIRREQKERARDAEIERLREQLNQTQPH